MSFGVALLLFFTLHPHVYSCVQSLVMVSCTRKVLWLRSAYLSDGSESFYKTEYICTHEADNQMPYHCEAFLRTKQKTILDNFEFGLPNRRKSNLLYL